VSTRHIAVLAIATAILAPSTPCQKVPAELRGAQGQLDHRMENEVQGGAQACVDADSVPATELLLGVMERQRQLSRTHLSAAHYRDVTFPYVTKIKDIYAQRRVAIEMRKNRKYPFARQWAAEALGFYGRTDHGPALVKALGDKHLGVRRWAAWSLGKIGFAPAVNKLKSLTGHTDEFVRGNAIEALVRIDPQFAGTYQTAVRGDRDGGVRAALLRAAPEVLKTGAESLAITALKDKDWRPRMQAVDNLRSTKTKTSVDALITALNDARPVVGVRALTSLQKLTGQPIVQKDVWPKWWQDNRETFQFPESSDGKTKAKRRQATVAFEGIPLDSDHVAFVLDKSYWMKKRVESSGKSETRDAAALEELRGVVKKLTGTDVEFSIWIYDEEVERLGKKSVKLTKKTAARALKFAAADASGREKNAWQVLEEVVMDPKIDTIYYISSGEADAGLYVHGNRLGRHIADLNRFYKKTIHSIAYSQKGFFRHVKPISDLTGGTFRGIE